jgi:hypothetical protein
MNGKALHSSRCCITVRLVSGGVCKQELCKGGVDSVVRKDLTLGAVINVWDGANV